MTLVSFWFLLIALLWLGFLLLEGFDFGVGALLRVLGRDPAERRQVLRTIGPVWDANEVWLIVAGASMFAAFPEWYATMFSGFYLALLLILCALIVRGMAVEYRNKREEAWWQARWDWAIVISSGAAAFLWGVAFVNLVAGSPLDVDHEYTGNLLTQLGPQALLGGLATLSVFCLHGTAFVALRTTGPVRARAAVVGRWVWPVATLSGAATLLWLVAADDTRSWLAVAATGVAAAALLVQPLLWSRRGSAASGSAASGAAASGASASESGAAGSPSAAGLLSASRREGLLFALTGLTIACIVVTVFASLWPDVMPSTGPAGSTLTAAEAASTPYTLKVMTWIAAFMLPVVLLYQAWTYWIFRQRISPTPRGEKLGFGRVGEDDGDGGRSSVGATPAGPGPAPGTTGVEGHA